MPGGEVVPGEESVREIQLQQRVRQLEDQLARKTAEAEALAREAAVVDGLADDVLVSLGTVEDVGRRTGEMLAAAEEWSVLKGAPADSLSAEDSRRLLDLDRQRASAFGALQEIEDFQNDPDEYAAFFKGLFEATVQLTPDDLAKVEDYMRQRAREMAADGLNAAREPDDPDAEEAWEARRDAFNEITTEGLRTILPPGSADRIKLDDSLLELLEGDFDKAGSWAN